MADYLDDIPKITWGASFANTLYPGYSVDNPDPYNDRREGSEIDVAPSGARDSWSLGTDEFLAFDARWIPGDNGTTPEGNTITGWDGATGWAAFIEWARDMNAFRFYPDKDVGSYHTCLLVKPISGSPGRESDGTKRIRIVMVDTGGNAFTGYVYSP